MRGIHELRGRGYMNFGLHDLQCYTMRRGLGLIKRRSRKSGTRVKGLYHKEQKMGEMESFEEVIKGVAHGGASAGDGWGGRSRAREDGGNLECPSVDGGRCDGGLGNSETVIAVRKQNEMSHQEP